MKVILTKQEIDYIFSDIKALADFTAALHMAKTTCKAEQFTVDHEEGETPCTKDTTEEKF